MKYIISTTGQKILFTLNKDRKFVIDPMIPLEVTEAEYKILDNRLGHQLNVVNPSPTIEKNLVVEESAAPLEADEV